MIFLRSLLEYLDHHDLHNWLFHPTSVSERTNFAQWREWSLTRSDKQRMIAYFCTISMILDKLVKSAKLKFMKMNPMKPSCWSILFAVMCGILISNSAQNVYAADATELFLKSCAPCHGKDGKAETPAAKKLGVKDLSLSTLNDAQIEQQIREGKQANQSTSKMPAFNERLTDEEIKSLVPVAKQFRNPPTQPPASN